MASSVSLAEHAERLVYRVAGLPVALSALWLSAQAGDSDSAAIEAAFAFRFWHPSSASEWLELLLALIVWPVGVAGSILWFTARNGAIIRRWTGRGVAAQAMDQLRLYFLAGVLSPWYYIFSLHEEPTSARARSFFERFETKTCLFPLLKRKRGSPLNDKLRFAAYCEDHGINCVPTLMGLDGQPPAAELPDCDLFVKPRKGRGGRGAERWDRVSPSAFSGPDGSRLDRRDLLDTLLDRSARVSLIVQPRLVPNPALADLTTGALPTVRVVTCLNERNDPEVIGGVFRMSVGANSTVDNLHAGGIAANVGLDGGALSKATNLGTDSRLGWLSKHPDTGAVIEGRELPLWEETKQLAVEAHRAFDDRVVIGWDIAILEDGPVLVEGNGNPDMDILQRFMPTGLRQHRFGQLVAHHLRLRMNRPSLRLSRV